MSSVAELRRKTEAENPFQGEVERLRDPGPVVPLWRRRSVRVAGLLLILLLAAVVVTPWLMARWSHVAISDSRIAADMVTVSSQVSGRIVEIPVAIGDTVQKGDLLVRIDRRQAQLALDAIEAEITSIEAQQAQLRAQQEMIRTQVARKIEAGQAEITAAEAAHTASQAVMRAAQGHFDRVQVLAERNVVAQQELDQARADLATAVQEEHSAAAGIETARANLAVTKAGQAEIDVLDRQIAVLEAQKAAQIAERDQQRIEVAEGEIRADFSGVVDNTFIDAGEYVAPGTRLLIYHDPSSVWVDANVKETDFSRLEIGAPVRITVDAYPDREFTGKVTRLGEAATSEFALLPSPNPSGNFTKVTQRLPIRISVDQKDGLLRPGMMVEVSIDVLD